MAQEEKELLLKDLCARLRYGVKIAAVVSNGEPNTIGGYCELLEDFYVREVDGWFNVSMIKPYLRSVSTMTMEERDEYTDIKKGECNGCVLTGKGDPDTEFLLVDWLNAHHFDYRGLIEKGLALEAPEGMYK